MKVRGYLYLNKDVPEHGWLHGEDGCVSGKSEIDSFCEVNMEILSYGVWASLPGSTYTDVDYFDCFFPMHEVMQIVITAKGDDSHLSKEQQDAWWNEEAKTYREQQE